MSDNAKHGSSGGSGRPRLLDVFCGAGGCSVGYHRAGFDVVGVDIAPQKNYPFEFHCADAIEYLAEHGDEFDAITASPPCQAHCSLKHVTGKTYTCFIDATRDLLLFLGKPWIIENVVGAPLKNPIMLCGSAFGLKVRRHRLFESSHVLFETGCNHKAQGQPIGVYGESGGNRKNPRTDGKGGNCRKPRSLEEAREAMGIDWATRKELAQMIPPAYTSYLGKQLLNYIAQQGIKP